MKLGKNCRFSNTHKLFSFLAKHNFLKDLYTTALYLLDFIGFYLNLVYFHMQIYPVTGEWDEANWLDPFISHVPCVTCPMRHVRCLMVCVSYHMSLREAIKNGLVMEFFHKRGASTVLKFLMKIKDLWVLLGTFPKRFILNMTIMGILGKLSFSSFCDQNWIVPHGFHNFQKLGGQGGVRPLTEDFHN